MENQLELKHLAPYLPCGLKVFYTHTEKIGQISNIYTIGEGYDEDDIKISIDYSEGEHIWMYKPILRPLSDLNTLGEGFVNEHTINQMLVEKHALDYGAFSYFRGDLDINIDGDPDGRYDQDKSISFNVVLDIYNELLKAKYDIFNLIEQGLAIPVTETFNPYK